MQIWGAWAVKRPNLHEFWSPALFFNVFWRPENPSEEKRKTEAGKNVDLFWSFPFVKSPISAQMWSWDHFRPNYIFSPLQRIVAACQIRGLLSVLIRFLERTESATELGRDRTCVPSKNSRGQLGVADCSQSLRFLERTKSATEFGRDRIRLLKK